MHAHDPGARLRQVRQEGDSAREAARVTLQAARDAAERARLAVARASAKLAKLR
jgi:hypothetical protein